jgi:hypothetical protein
MLLLIFLKLGIGGLPPVKTHCCDTEISAAFCGNSEKQAHYGCDSLNSKCVVFDKKGSIFA